MRKSIIIREKVMNRIAEISEDCWDTLSNEEFSLDVSIGSMND